MELSARNQIRGRVKSIKKGDIQSEVVIEVEPASLTATITSGSVQRLALKAGDYCWVIVKSTDLIVGK